MKDAERQRRIAEEAALVSRAREGDDSAFETLVNRYSRQVIGYCYKMVGRGGPAEDLAQEIFVKLYLALPSFDLAKPLTPFLFRIAHNHCLDWVRKKKIQTVSFTVEGRDGEGSREIEHASPDPGPEDEMKSKEIDRRVEEALASLPETYRSALVMYHRQNMTYEQISEALGLPMGTVKARIHRGRDKLQQMLRDLVMP